MKKLLAIFLATVMLLGILPFSAFAANNGPSTAHETWDGEVYYYAFISAQIPGEDGGTYTFFANNQAYSDVYPGIEYNRDINELRFDSTAGTSNMLLHVNMMGDDFTIRIDGRVELGQITVWGDGYGGNLNIKGNGELIVNSEKEFDSAINIFAEGTDGKVNFGKDVKVKLYSASDEVIKTVGSVNESANDAFVFENGQSFNVKKSAYTYEDYENVSGIYYDEPERDNWGGELLKSKSDPDGIYTLTTGYRGEDKDNTLYWVNKLVYIDKYDAYYQDYNYFNGNPKNNYGELEFTAAEWEAQDEYTLVGEIGDEPQEFEWQDESLFGTTTYHVAYKVERASEPDGHYAYDYYTVESGGIVTEHYTIYRFVYDSDNKAYVKDSSFEPIEMAGDELKNSSEWSIVYEFDTTTVKWKGYVNVNEYLSVYKDSSGKKYAVAYGEEVYDYTEGDGVNVGDNFFVYVERNNEIDVSSLVRSSQTVTVDDMFNYSVLGNELIYVGDGSVPEHRHTYTESVVKPTATTLGYTVHTCIAGDDEYIDTYTAPTGKIGGFKCKARTAAAQTIIWNKVAGVTGYQIQMSNAAGNKWEVTKALTANSITFKSLKAGNNYKFRVRFYIKAADGKNYFSPWSATLNSPTLPSATSLTKVTAGSKSFTANWKKQAVTGYQVQYSLKSNFSGAKTVTIKNAKTLKTTVKKLSAKKVYYVRVRTYKTINKANYFSTWSKAVKVKTK